MSISEIIKEVYASFKGKWLKSIVIMLVYILIPFLLNFIEETLAIKEDILSKFYLIALFIPFSFGLIISFMKIKRGETIGIFEFIEDGLSNFSKSWGIFFHTLLRMFLPILLITLIIPFLCFITFFSFIDGFTIVPIICIPLCLAAIQYSISKFLLYIVAYHIGYDNPELSSKKCVQKSKSLIIGHRKTIFLLLLPFMGLVILFTFTLRVELLMLLPYMQVPIICFYDKLIYSKAQKIKIEE